jgi:hypothetical protein
MLTPSDTKTKIIDYLQLYPASSRQSIITWLNFEVELQVIDKCLEELEREGRISYNPRSRLFMPTSKRKEVRG